MTSWAIFTFIVFYFLNLVTISLKGFKILYPKLIVIHIGQIPNLKKKRTTFLWNGKFAGIIGQLTPSPSNSFIPQTFIDCSIICIFWIKEILAEEMINTYCCQGYWNNAKDYFCTWFHFYDFRRLSIIVFMAKSVIVMLVSLKTLSVFASIKVTIPDTIDLSFPWTIPQTCIILPTPFRFVW